MTPTFWKNSIFEKPTDRGFVCHASAEGSICVHPNYVQNLSIYLFMTYSMQIHAAASEILISGILCYFNTQITL